MGIAFLGLVCLGSWFVSAFAYMSNTHLSVGALAFAAVAAAISMASAYGIGAILERGGVLSPSLEALHVEQRWLMAFRLLLMIPLIRSVWFMLTTNAIRNFPPGPVYLALATWAIWQALLLLVVSRFSPSGAAGWSFASNLIFIVWTATVLPTLLRKPAHDNTSPSWVLGVALEILLVFSAWKVQSRPLSRPAFRWGMGVGILPFGLRFI